MSKLNVASIVDACEIQFNVPLKDWNEPELIKFYAKYGKELDITEQQQAKSIAITKKDMAKRNGITLNQCSYRKKKPVTLVDNQGKQIHFDSFKAAAKFLGCKDAYISVIKEKPQSKRMYKGYTFYFEEEGGIDHG